MKQFTWVLALAAVVVQGCSPEFLGGGATGLAGATAGYEVAAKRQMDQLEQDYRDGKINAQEYEIRKSQIRRGSLIY